MSPLSIAQAIISVLGNSEGMARSIIQAVGAGYAEKAEPWLSIGFVGLRFLLEAVKAIDDPDKLKELLTRSPNDIWGEAKSVEVEVELIKEAQRARIAGG